MFNLFKLSKKKPHFFTIVDFQSQSVKLIVAYYYTSTFYVIFNEKLIKNANIKTSKLRFSTWEGTLLNKLVKKARKELKIKITNISFNFPVDQIKIKNNYTYYHRFKIPVIFNQNKLDLVIRQVLMNQPPKSDYSSLYFLPQKYHLPDKQITTTEIPTGYVTNLQIQGVLYQANWKQLIQYLQFFENANLKPAKPLLLPYAIYINTVLLFNQPHVLIFHWEQNYLNIFYFYQNTFIKQKQFSCGLKILFNQLVLKFNLTEQDAQNYFYNLIDLDRKNDVTIEKQLLKNNLNFCQEYNEIVSLCSNFLQKNFTKVFNQIIHDWQLTLKSYNTLLVGQLTEINYIKVFLDEIVPDLDLKLFNQHFVGIDDYNDRFLIGNAYYQYLQNKHDEK